MMSTPLHHLRHWFTPHTTNNFRARLLHNSGIFAVIGLVVVGNIFLRLLDSPALHILGFSSSIKVDEVVRETNEQRIAAGLAPLNYSERLADAARRKADNMLREDYWAHNSPSGKSPWVWFEAAGYTYTYAGENLAKDFGNTDSMVSAWMASPTHRDNIVSPKYQEIGIAVVPGSLGGQETVLVVELFGTPATPTLPKVASATVSKREPEPAPVVVAQVEELPPPAILHTPAPRPEPLSPPAPLNYFTFARLLNIATTALFILALILDLVISHSRVLSRRVGDNWAHLIFINVILLATTIAVAGKIL